MKQKNKIPGFSVVVVVVVVVGASVVVVGGGVVVSTTGGGSVGRARESSISVPVITPSVGNEGT